MPVTVNGVSLNAVAWDDTNPDITYVCYSAILFDAGDLTRCIIERIDNINNTIYLAEGSLNFDKVWANRATYTYTVPLPMFIGNYTGVMKSLEYYSVPVTDTDHTVEHLFYIKRDLPENMPDDLIDLLTWYAAYDTCMALSNVEGAKIAMQKIQEIQRSETF